MSTLSQSKMRTLKDKHLELETKEEIRKAKESVNTVKVEVKPLEDKNNIV